MNKIKKADYKIPGGKLVSAEIKIKNGLLTHVKIYGDFFMHPEEAIIRLEENLSGKPVEDIEEIVNRFFKNYDITLFGVSPSDFVHVLNLTV